MASLTAAPFSALKLTCEVLHCPPAGPGQPGLPAPPGGGGGSGPIRRPPGPTLGGTFPSPIPGGAGISTTTTTTETGQSTQSEGIINVINSVNIANDSASSAARAVEGAVTGALSAAGQIASQTANAVGLNISNGLYGLTTTIGQGINDAFTGIGDVVKGIEGGLSQTLGNIGADIGSTLNSLLNPATSALTQILLILTNQIGGLAGQVAQAVAVIIPQIAAAISNPIGELKQVLIGIEGEIGRNLESLVQLPGAIAQSTANIDSTLLRVLANWEAYNTQFVESQTGWGGEENAHKDMKSIADALAGLINLYGGKATVKLSDSLKTFCKGANLDEILARPWYLGSTVGSIAADFSFVLVKFFEWALQVSAGALKFVEEARLKVNEECPLETLPPNALVDAVLRGFLKQSEAETEAAKGNLSPSRLQTLIDLATHQFSPAELVEMQYRGIITQDDFYAALRALGWPGPHQVLLQRLAVPQFRLSLGNALYDLVRRGTIQDSDFDRILQAQNYDDPQRKAIKSLTFRPPEWEEAIGGDASEQMFAQLGVAGLGEIPEHVQVAGFAEGFNPETQQLKWQEHFTVGGVGTWVTLYFRGLATLDELHAVMDRAFIPRQIQDRILESERPIVQFRTISTMVNLKLITPERGKELLKKRGFDDENADLLIQYAERPGKATASQKAAQQHEVSLSIAKREFIDGSIDENQYYQILIAHGYTIDGANTEIALEKANQAMLLRKERAQLVVDEYGSGLINEQVALAQLAAIGLTVYEIARYTHKIRAFRATRTKVPSESELHGMLSKGVITGDAYVAALESAGYSKMWADNLLAWRTAAGSVTPSSTPATPPTP